MQLRDHSEDSFVLAVWQVTDHQPNKSSEEAGGFRNKLQYVCKCLYLYACTCIYIRNYSKYVCILCVYMHRYSHMTVLCHTYYFSAWSCLVQYIWMHISTPTLQIALQIVVSLLTTNSAQRRDLFSPSSFHPSPLSKPRHQYSTEQQRLWG